MTEQVTCAPVDVQEKSDLDISVALMRPRRERRAASSSAIRCRTGPPDLSSHSPRPTAGLATSTTCRCSTAPAPTCGSRSWPASHAPQNTTPAPLAIMSISPTEGLATQRVSVSGSGFVAGARRSLGGLPANGISASDSRLRYDPPSPRRGHRRRHHQPGRSQRDSRRWVYLPGRDAHREPQPGCARRRVLSHLDVARTAVMVR